MLVPTFNQLCSSRVYKITSRQSMLAECQGSKSKHHRHVYTCPSTCRWSRRALPAGSATVLTSPVCRKHSRDQSTVIYFTCTLRQPPQTSTSTGAVVSPRRTDRGIQQTPPINQLIKISFSYNFQQCCYIFRTAMNDQQTREYHVPQKRGNIDNRCRGAATGMNEESYFQSKYNANMSCRE